jgi:hypothetical protein
VGKGLDQNVWAPIGLAKGYARLLSGDIASRLLGEILGLSWRSRPLSDKRFTVGNTMIEACAEGKCFRPKHGKPLE